MDTIKQAEMKEKNKKRIPQENEKTTRNHLIKEINIWAVSLVRYSVPFLKWTRVELQKMDQRTRKLMAMRRDDVDWLYLPPTPQKKEEKKKKKEGRRIANI